MHSRFEKKPSDDAVIAQSLVKSIRDSIDSIIDLYNPVVPPMPVQEPDELIIKRERKKRSIIRKRKTSI